MCVGVNMSRGMGGSRLQVLKGGSTGMFWSQITFGDGKDQMVFWEGPHFPKEYILTSFGGGIMVSELLGGARRPDSSQKL